MRMVDLIQKKRDGHALTNTEIEAIIQGYMQGEIPDYQMSAWAMAVYFQHMNAEETAGLTRAMVDSGEMIDLASIAGIKVDKHSTGGVGDSTTLVVAPLVASCGVPVAKMSGRGLGHTGGTIDKLESFAGFTVDLTRERFIELVNEHKLAVTAQTGNLTPADKKLYALRDVTATVDSLPLIASSIMSKKIASGADAICLDVKAGSGAFMKTEKEARALAQAMVDIGRAVGRQTTAVISNMNQPLGQAIGNALEVKEAIATLQGKGPKDLLELSLTLGSHMLVLAKRVADKTEARQLLLKKIESGQALAQFAQFVQAQGGNPDHVYDPEQLPCARFQLPVYAKQSGYVQQIDAQEIGLISMILGAGRMKKEERIDLSVGIELHKKVGDNVTRDEHIATLHTNEIEQSDATARLIRAYTMTSIKPNPLLLILGEIS